MNELVGIIQLGAEWEWWIRILIFQLILFLNLNIKTPSSVRLVLLIKTKCT